MMYNISCKDNVFIRKIEPLKLVLDQNLLKQEYYLGYEKLTIRDMVSTIHSIFPQDYLEAFQDVLKHSLVVEGVYLPPADVFDTKIETFAIKEPAVFASLSSLDRAELYVVFDLIKYFQGSIVDPIIDKHLRKYRSNETSFVHEGLNDILSIATDCVYTVDKFQDFNLEVLIYCILTLNEDIFLVNSYIDDFSQPSILFCIASQLRYFVNKRASVINISDLLKADSLFFDRSKLEDIKEEFKSIDQGRKKVEEEIMKLIVQDPEFSSALINIKLRQGKPKKVQITTKTKNLDMYYRKNVLGEFSTIQTDIVAGNVSMAKITKKLRYGN